MCLGIVWENSGYGQGKSGNFIFKSRHLEREFCCSIVRNHLCSRHSLIVLDVLLCVELLIVVCFRQMQYYQCQCSWHTWFGIIDGAILSSSE